MLSDVQEYLILQMKRIAVVSKLAVQVNLIKKIFTNLGITVTLY